MDEVIHRLTEGVEGEAEGGGLGSEVPFEGLPESFDGVEFGTVGRKIDEGDVGRWGEGTGFVGGGVVQYQDMKVVRVLLTKVFQKELETGGIEAGEFQPEGVSGGRFDGGVQPGVFVEGGHNFQGFDAACGDAPPYGEMQPNTGFILPP